MKNFLKIHSETAISIVCFNKIVVFKLNSKRFKPNKTDFNIYRIFIYLNIISFHSLYEMLRERIIVFIHYLSSISFFDETKAPACSRYT
jgi:hypothetical protein